MDNERKRNSLTNSGLEVMSINKGLIIEDQKTISNKHIKPIKPIIYVNSMNTSSIVGPGKEDNPIILNQQSEYINNYIRQNLNCETKPKKKNDLITQLKKIIDGTPTHIHEHIPKNDLKSSLIIKHPINILSEPLSAVSPKLIKVNSYNYHFNAYSDKKRRKKSFSRQNSLNGQQPNFTTTSNNFFQNQTFNLSTEKSLLNISKTSSSYLYTKTFVDQCVRTQTLNEISKDIVASNGGFRRLFKSQVISDSEMSDDPLLEEDLDSPYILHPNSTIVLMFNYLVLFGLLYTITIYPLQIAFVDNAAEYDKIGMVLIDMLYFIDILFHFFVGFYDNDDKLILNLKVCSIHYLKSTFLLNVITGVPFSTFIYIKEYPALRTLPLIRIIKFFRFLEKESEVTRYKSTNSVLFFIKPVSVFKPFYSFLEFFIGVFLFCHLSSCILIFLSTFDYPNWLCDELISHPKKENKFYLYTLALYFSLATIISVGYGDVTVTNKIERTYNIILMIFGVCLYSFAISIVSSLFEKLMEREKEENKRLYIAHEIKKSYPISDDLFERLIRYLNFTKSYNRNNPSLLIESLPKHLKNKLMYKMNENSMKHLNFLKDKTYDFKYKAIQFLKQINYIKNEYVVQLNDMIDEIYMIKKGKLQLQKETGMNNTVIKIIKLHQNEHFGEIYMTLGIAMPYDVIVESKFAELFYIKKSDFINLYEEFPIETTSMLRYSWKNTLRIEARARKMYKKLELDEILSVGLLEPFLADSSSESKKEPSIHKTEQELNTSLNNNMNTLNSSNAMSTTPIINNTNINNVSININNNFFQNFTGINDGINIINQKMFNHGDKIIHMQTIKEENEQNSLIYKKKGYEHNDIGQSSNESMSLNNSSSFNNESFSNFLTKNNSVKNDLTVLSFHLRNLKTKKNDSSSISSKSNQSSSTILPSLNKLKKVVDLKKNSKKNIKTTIKKESVISIPEKKGQVFHLPLINFVGRDEDTFTETELANKEDKGFFDYKYHSSFDPMSKSIKPETSKDDKRKMLHISPTLSSKYLSLKSFDFNSKKKFKNDDNVSTTSPQRRRKKSTISEVLNNMKSLSSALNNPRNIIRSIEHSKSKYSSVKEYQTQLERVEELYENILRYYAEQNIKNKRTKKRNYFSYK